MSKNILPSPTLRSHIEYVDTSFAGIKSPSSVTKKNRAMSNLQYRLQGSLNIPAVSSNLPGASAESYLFTKSNIIIKMMDGEDYDGSRTVAQSGLNSRPHNNDTKIDYFD